MKTFGKINLKTSNCPFDSVEYIDMSLISINKKYNYCCS